MKDTDKVTKETTKPEDDDLQILEDEPKTVKIELTLPDFRRLFRRLRRGFFKLGRAIANTFVAIGMFFAGLFKKPQNAKPKSQQLRAENPQTETPQAENSQTEKSGAEKSRTESIAASKPRRDDRGSSGFKNGFTAFVSGIRPALIRAWEFVKRYRYYFIAGLIVVIAIVVLLIAFVGKSSRKKVGDPMAGLEKRFEVDKHKDVNKLIADYHEAYAAGDVDAIMQLASPVTDAEQSYIKFFSQYIEGYDNVVCYTKQGLYKGAYLVSVSMDMKFTGIDTPAQGLEFFYVQTRDDSLYIDNLYSSFNTANEELDQDASVRALIDAYENSDDVKELAAEIEKKCAESFASDPSLENFVNVTLQQKISSWAVDYVASIHAEKNPETEPEEEELSTEESIALAKEEDEKDLEDVKVNASNVNVRAEADKESEKLGTLDRGTQLIRYSFTESGWSKIDYNGQQAYVRSEFLDVVTPEGDPIEAPEADGAEETEVAGLEPGSTIEINDALNVRKKSDQTSDKIGVAHAGDKVTIVKVLDNGWTQVKWNGKEGYIKTEFLQ